MQLSTSHDKEFLVPLAVEHSCEGKMKCWVRRSIKADTRYSQNHVRLPGCQVTAVAGMSDTVTRVRRYRL